ncbi:MAG: hypothetical protein ACP5O4_05960 [bacterium]
MKIKDLVIKIITFLLILLLYFLVYIIFIDNNKRNKVILADGEYYSLTKLPSFKNQVIMFNFYNKSLNKFYKQFYGRSQGKIKISKDFLYLNENIITNKYILNIRLYKIPYDYINLELVYDLKNHKLVTLKINQNTIEKKNIFKFSIDFIEIRNNYIYFLLYLQGDILLKNNIYIEKSLLKLLFIKKE